MLTKRELNEIKGYRSMMERDGKIMGRREGRYIYIYIKARRNARWFLKDGKKKEKKRERKELERKLSVEGTKS